MIINQHLLLKAAPIKDMVDHKVPGVPTSWGLTECGYDIRLKQDIRFMPNGGGMIASVLEPEESYPKQTHGIFVLGSSVEEFDMPSHLMGRVLNKSTWARKGLDASLTTNIEPGWKGFLTIELVYNGREDLHIPAGSGICQVIFETLAVPAHYHGKYQRQADRPVKAKTTLDAVDLVPDHKLSGMTRGMYQPNPSKRGFTPR